MRKLRTKRIKFWIFPLFFLIILSGLIFGLPKLIKIRAIICKSQFGLCPEQVTNVINSVLGKDLKRTKNELNTKLADNLYVEKFQINFKIPDKIEVNLVIRKPYYALRNQSNYYLVSKDGLIIAMSENSSLPFIEVNQDFSIGEKLDSKILFALKIVSDIFSIYQISLSRLDGSSLLVEMSTGTKAIFPLEGDTKVLVGAFRMIFEQLNSSHEKFRIEKAPGQIVIDLRYKNPVIR